MYFSPFWRLDVQDQGACRVGEPLWPGSNGPALPWSVPRRALPAPGPRLACVLRWPFQGLLQTEKSFSARGGDTWLHLPEKGRLRFVKCSVLSNKSVMVYAAAKATEPQQTKEPPFTGLGPCCGLFTQEHSSPATGIATENLQRIVNPTNRTQRSQDTDGTIL